MDLRKLRHAQVLSEEGSFARASTRLHITQSALSRSVQALEQELGVRLFDRHASGVWLTQPGKLILARAGELLRMANGLQRDAELIRDARLGSLAFGAGPIPAQLILPEVLPRVMAAHPGLQIQVDIQPAPQLLERLLKESLEFFVADVSQLAEADELVTEPLAHLDVGFYVRREHPLAGRGEVAVELLGNYPLASHGFAASTVAEEGGLLRWSGRIACEHVAILKAVAVGTDAVLMTAAAVIAGECAAGDLVPLRISGYPLPWLSDLRVVRLGGRSLSPAAQLLIAAMKRHLQESP